MNKKYLFSLIFLFFFLLFAHGGWLPGREVTLQIPLRDLPSREVLNMSGLPAGNYTFYFGVDLNKNGNINMRQAYYDLVEVTINP